MQKNSSCHQCLGTNIIGFSEATLFESVCPHAVQKRFATTIGFSRNNVCSIFMFTADVADTILVFGDSDGPTIFWNVAYQSIP